jgi:hypothetical protein
MLEGNKLREIESDTSLRDRRRNKLNVKRERSISGLSEEVDEIVTYGFGR